MAERVAGGAAHAAVAREEHISRYQVARAFTERAGERGRATSTARRGGCRSTRPTTVGGGELATVVSDLDRRLVSGVLDGRDRRTVERWLSALPAQMRAGIEVVSINPYDGDRQAIRAALPHARAVCDPFHLMRGANAALTRRAARASASATPAHAGAGARAAAASTPPGGPSSTAPATGCSRPASA